MFRQFLITALIFIVSAVHAQSIQRFEVSLNTSNGMNTSLEINGLIQVSANGSREKSCGIRVDFGDSSSLQIMEIPINQLAEFKYKYTKPGVFAVSVKGGKINRFLDGVVACQGQAIQIASILDPVQLEDGSLDLVIMARTKPGRKSGTPHFANNLDGTAKLLDMNSPICLNTILLKPKLFGNNDSTVINEIFAAQQLTILSSNDLYKQAGLSDLQKQLIGFYEKSLQASGHTNNEQCNAVYGSKDFGHLGSIFEMSEVIAVPKWLLPSMKKIRYLSEIQNYSPWITLSVQQAKQLALESQQKSRQNEQLKSKSTNEVSVLAESNSKEKIGSLVISYERMRNRNKSQPLNVCTLVNQDQDGAAVSGYLGQNLNMLLPDMREQYTQAGWIIDKKFNAVFNNVNDAFIEISRKPDACHIFIEFPKNLALLDAGIKQNKTLTSSFGMVIESSVARELFSTQRGYPDYSAYQFARSISANANDLKKLNAAGVNNKSDFDMLVAEIKQSQYSNISDLNTVFSYIADRDRGLSKKTSALVERDIRIAEEKVRREKEELERQRQKEAFAREFPYEAIMSCDYQGTHTNLVSCFAGDVGTELEIRNGGNYRMYKSFELYQLGHERPREGLVIPLGSNFEIKAQNSNDTLTLTLKIRETATGKFIFTKSAAKYGVISVAR